MISHFLKKELVFGILLLLSGCVSLPKDEQRENLLSAPSVQDSVRSSVESGLFSLGNWPQENWWDLFQSAELNELIGEALSHNPSIQSIERRVEYAKQTAKVVRSKLFPFLFFDADETWQYLSKNGLYRALNPKVPLNANLVDLTLSFTYEFDFWGKNRNLFNAALGEEKAQEAEAAQVTLITTTAVAQAYFALKTNLVRKRLFEALYDLRSKVLDLQVLLQDKALLSMLPPLLSAEDLLEAEKLLFSIEQEVETDKHLLNILVGAGPDAPLQIAEELPPTLDSITIPDNLSIDLLSRRPDLMAQIWRVESLAHEVGAAKADFYPNINLTAFAGLESVLYRNLLKASSKSGGLQPAIHLPIFTAGQIRANVRAKKALFDEAVFSYNQLLLQSASEVADLLVLAKATFEQKADQEQIVDAALNRCEITSLRRLSGLDNSLAEYFIEEELILKELDNVTLLYTQYLATIKLIKALGGGYQSAYSLPLTALGDRQ
ncbi:MAG: efflux transporter outer membrane subunit [Verrucomicrobia bacterium]|nr:efflux transporter outer membrane subunit [Verrucomicrobiota bacterium]